MLEQCSNVCNMLMNLRMALYLSRWRALGSGWIRSRKMVDLRKRGIRLWYSKGQDQKVRAEQAQ